jgi:hypothetical protein
MNFAHSILFAVALATALPLSIASAVAADSPELADARAKLLDAYQRGQTDEDNHVKQLRSKIAALEYIAAAGATAAQRSESRVISVDFPGGPASALIAAIGKSDRDNSFNVIGEKEDLAIELPAFSVRNADPAALANALNGILQPRGYILAPSGRVDPGQSPVFTLRKLTPYETDQRQVGQFQSFQLAPYLELQTVDDITGAIRAAWELDPARSPTALRLKFHPPTGILLVSAPQDGLRVVQAVLNELRRSERDPNMFTPAKKSPPVPQR